MFFDNWEKLLQVLVSAAISYGAVVLFLRLFGKRTLSKWNAFDFIVTVALGSTLATVILSKDVTIAEGILALFLLMLLQFIITFISVRYKPFNKVIKSSPIMLYEKGNFHEDDMKKARVVKGEILSAIRSDGISALEDVRAVVLETDGSFSVVKYSNSGSDSALQDVAGRR